MSVFSDFFDWLAMGTYAQELSDQLVLKTGAGFLLCLAAGVLSCLNISVLFKMTIGLKSRIIWTTFASFWLSMAAKVGAKEIAAGVPLNDMVLSKTVFVVAELSMFLAMLPLLLWVIGIVLFAFGFLILLAKVLYTSLRAVALGPRTEEGQSHSQLQKRIRSESDEHFDLKGASQDDFDLSDPHFDPAGPFDDFLFPEPPDSDHSTRDHVFWDRSQQDAGWVFGDPDGEEHWDFGNAEDPIDTSRHHSPAGPGLRLAAVNGVRVDQT